MPEFLTSWPFLLIFAFMFAGAMMRGQSIYWLGRVVTQQTLQRTAPTSGWKLRAHRVLSGDSAQRGVAAIRRWGLLAIPFAYLTVGFQSMVMAGAGVLRIGWAVWEAALAAAAGSPAGLAAIGLLVVVLAATIVTRRRRIRRGEVALDPAPTLVADDDDRAA